MRERGMCVMRATVYTLVKEGEHWVKDKVWFVCVCCRAEYSIKRDALMDGQRNEAITNSTTILSNKHLGAKKNGGTRRERVGKGGLLDKGKKKFPQAPITRGHRGVSTVGG
jgi:hypothetical protein